MLCILDLVSLQQWLYAEIQGNKTLGLSTVVIVIWAPFTCGNHYILSAGLKKKKEEKKQGCRELEICERIRSVTRSLNGPLSVCTKRFCYCRTPGSVGPSTDTQSLSRWRGGLKHKFNPEQIKNTQA